MKKSAQVVMLPTNEKANIWLDNFGTGLYNCPTGATGVIYQHLYILSDEKIKEGDWCYGMDGIFQYKGKVNLPDIELPKKIIAATNLIPQSFIEKYVKEYNKGNVITDVMVEYESIGAYANPKYDSDYQLKINSDNTINISMPKDSWSREEVTTLLYSLNRDKEGNFDCTKWIEENL